MNTATEQDTLTRDDLIEAIVGDVPSKYGAPMGRQGSNTLEPDLCYTVVYIPLFEGYDQGGAYWGIEQALYACIAVIDGDEFIEYARHDSYDSFASYLSEYWESTAIDGGSLPCYDLNCECNACGEQWCDYTWRENPALDCPDCGSSDTTIDIVE